MRLKKALLIAAALVLLAGVIVFAHLPGGSGGKTGSAVGETPADFTVTCLDGSVFTLSEYRGRTVVVNLWATWCGPCVAELPDFDRLQREYPESVAVLALHTEDPTEDVAAYLAPKGWSFAAAVAPDASLPDALGGGATLPRTVVIAPDGRVIYNQTGSVTYETLERLIMQETE